MAMLGVKGQATLQDSIADTQQFMHSSNDTHPSLLLPLFQTLAQVSDRGIAAQGGHGWQVETGSDSAGASVRERRL